MAAYNAAAFIQAAVDSISAQSFTDWTLIVVDDGSKDDTFDILSAYASRDRRIKPLRQTINRGLAHSLNVGISQTQSELIARMDADDECLAQRLAAQAEFMAEHLEVAVLGSAAEIVLSGEERNRILTRPEKHEDLVREIHYRNPFIHPSVMFRRAFIDRMEGYSVGLRRAQDYDLWLRGYRYFRFHNLPETLVRYRVPRRLTLRNAAFTAWVVWRAVVRERRWWTHGLFALRPLAGYAAQRLGYRG